MKPGIDRGLRMLAQTVACDLRTWILALVFSSWASTALLAQVPKVGKYYEDASDLYFKIKVPLDWEFIPPAPDDGNLIGKYDPPTNKYVEIGANSRVYLSAWLIKFDRRTADAQAAPKGERKTIIHTEKNLTDWINNNVGNGFHGDNQKDLEVNKVGATEFLYSSQTDQNAEVRVYAMLYRLKPDVDVAIVFNGPGDKRWNKYSSVFEALARSFHPLETKALVEPPAASAKNGSLRERKRAQLQARLAREPGWKLYESEHYFIVSNNDDKPFIDELMGRLEAIHAIYEQDYPLAKVMALRAAKTRGRDQAPEADKPSPDAPASAPAPAKSETPVDPGELARASVVRVCATEEQYHSYGGPGMSAGYWNWNAEELVLYVDKSGGVRNTWSVLNHEAFHQYIFYFYGSLAPHSWYNEGTGDFYSGYEYGKNKRFTLKPFNWRTDVIKDMLQRSAAPGEVGPKAYVPLASFVRMTQAEYYDPTKAGQNYAQGWSLIYFLRTGKKNNARGWNPRWDTILDTYLETLASTGKVEVADDRAFDGVDFHELERAWFEYTR